LLAVIMSATHAIRNGPMEPLVVVTGKKRMGR
jgi:hypothetical protein